MGQEEGTAVEQREWQDQMWGGRKGPGVLRGPVRPELQRVFTFSDSLLPPSCSEPFMCVGLCPHLILSLPSPLAQPDPGAGLPHLPAQ